MKLIINDPFTYALCIIPLLLMIGNSSITTTSAESHTKGKGSSEDDITNIHNHINEMKIKEDNKKDTKLVEKKERREKRKRIKRARRRLQQENESLKNARCLSQCDFAKGPIIIDQPGVYKLCQDISFHPNVNPPSTATNGATNAFEPEFTGKYDPNAFGLGFFTALCIAAPNVKIYLNGFKIEQSKEHALLQRFFSVIELADSPFIEGVGPAQFVGDESGFNSGKDVEILGPGIIGRSSHHGIHGNDNRRVNIKDVTFQDFEVAAVSLNNVDKLLITRCDVKRNRHDVPVLGMFSAARFISPYGKILKEAGYKMNLRGVETSAADVYDRLSTSINNVYDDVMAYGQIIKENHQMEYELFNNKPRVVEGPCYAFLVHGRGPAVGDFGFDLSSNRTLTSSNVIIRQNKITNIKCWTNEVPAIVENNKVVNDARGAVFQLIRSTDKSPIAINNDGTYRGNVVADMQIMVAKAILEGTIQSTPQLQTSVNSIDSTIIDWASSSNSVYEPQYRCNGDSMHHVGKGMTMIRVEDVEGFIIRKNTISEISNLSPPLFDNCYDYHKGAHVDNRSSLQQGTNIRGISVGAVTGYASKKTSSIVLNTLVKFNSTYGEKIIGIDLQGQTDSIAIKGNLVNLSDKVGVNVEDRVFVGFCFRKVFDVGGIEDKNITLKNNKFKQGRETLNVKLLQSGRSSGCIYKEQKSEWQVGGTPGRCPFGFKKPREK